MTDSYRPIDSWRPARRPAEEHRDLPHRGDSWRPSINQDRRYRAPEQSRRRRTDTAQNDNQTRPSASTRVMHLPDSNAANQTTSLNQNASTSQPLRGFDTRPTNAGLRFTNYQPVRFSNGAQERVAMLSGNACWTASTPQAQVYRQYNTQFNQVRHFATYSPQFLDQTLPSIEPGSMNASGSRPYLEALRNLGPSRQITPRRTVSPPPAPNATDVYLAQARLPPILRSAPQKLLVILDLNGTLIVKPRNNPSNFQIRPGVPKLIQYLFENHVVMIYTSSQPRNADIVIDGLLGKKGRAKLAAVWARDKLELSPEQFYEKVQVYKKLDRIWADKVIQANHPSASQGGHWNQTNTVLVDDTHLKALAQPHNLLEVPEFKGSAPRNAKAPEELVELRAQADEEILQSLQLKLEELKYQSDVSRLILRWQTGKVEEPKVSAGNFVVREKQPDQLPRLQSGEAVADDQTLSENLSEDSEDDEIQRDLSRQMAMIRDEKVEVQSEHPEKKRAVSPIPDGVWTAILQGNNFVGLDHNLKPSTNGKGDH